MTVWVVYSRPGCSLCEEFCSELVEWLGPQAAAVQVVDITGDADLERKYGVRLPVLTVDGEFVCAYRLDRERLRLQPTPDSNPAPAGRIVKTWRPPPGT